MPDGPGFFNDLVTKPAACIIPSLSIKVLQHVATRICAFYIQLFAAKGIGDDIIGILLLAVILHSTFLEMDIQVLFLPPFFSFLPHRKETPVLPTEDTITIVQVLPLGFQVKTAKTKKTVPWGDIGNGVQRGNRFPGGDKNMIDAGVVPLIKYKILGGGKNLLIPKPAVNFHPEELINVGLISV